ncbi:MAG: adenylyl-sulfate kinase, partial [Caulobacteraceae bacterium]
CSFISPFHAERQMARELLAEGEFIEVFVDTTLEDCIARDPKGLYAKALKGEIANFTGVSSPYERPDDAEIVLDTAGASADELASRVVAELVRRGVV